MADTMCGPSNALQSFQKHAQIDRTLQQDRLRDPRHSSAQAFRSFDPRAGSLDADFHAFENAAPNPFQFADPFLNHTKHHAAPLFQQAPQTSASTWATDFQSMSIADWPLPAQQFRIEAPLIRSAPGGWQNEFMRQRENGLSSVSQGKQVALDHQSVATQQPMQNALRDYQQQLLHLQHADHQAQLQMQNPTTAEQASASDWAQAFDEAYNMEVEAEQVQSQSQSQSQSQEWNQDQILHQDGAYTNDRSIHAEQERPLVQDSSNVRIGSDAIDYKETQDRTADQDVQDANALARVAGELLHNIQHESDEKFQNSQFLELMRRIRDRQVEVRDNDFMDTSTGVSINPAAQSQTVIDARPPSPEQKDQPFTFPNMNQIYEPNAADGVDYSFEDDQFPRAQSQIQDLHPGGRRYPGSPTSMSGAIHGAYPQPQTNPLVEQFDLRMDENRALGSRFGGDNNALYN